MGFLERAFVEKVKQDVKKEPERVKKALEEAYGRERGQQIYESVSKQVRTPSKKGKRGKPTPPIPQLPKPEHPLEELFSKGGAVSRTIQEGIKKLEEEKQKPTSTPNKATYQEVLSSIDSQTKQLEQIKESLSQRNPFQKYIVNGKLIPAFALIPAVDKQLSELKEAKQKIINYKNEGYRIKKTEKGYIFYKTKEDIEKEHYEAVMKSYEKLPDWAKYARATSASILFGFANPRFWSALVTGGVEKARKVIAEEEYRWMKKHPPEKVKKQPLQTWAETYFLSYPMTNIVYPMAIGYGAGYAIGFASRVAPVAGRYMGLGVKYIGYGLAGYAGTDIAISLIKNKYEEALTKGFGYAMQFGSAYAGAKGLGGEPSYMKGYRHASKYWTSKYPSESINIIKNVKYVKDGTIVEGEHISLSRSSLRSASISRTRFKGILKPDGSFQILDIKGNIETYPIKKTPTGFEVVKSKVTITPMSSKQLSAKVSEIAFDMKGGNFIFRGARIGGGQTKFSINIPSSQMVMKGTLSEGKAFYRSFAFGKAGQTRFISSSYTYTSRRPLGYTFTRTKGVSIGETGFVDYVNDYGITFDVTKTRFGRSFSNIYRVASGKGIGKGGMKSLTYGEIKTIAGQISGQISKITPSFVSPKWFSGIPYAIGGINYAVFKEEASQVQDTIKVSMNRYTNTVSRNFSSLMTIPVGVSKGGGKARRGGYISYDKVIPNTIGNVISGQDQYMKTIHRLNEEIKDNIKRDIVNIPVSREITGYEQKEEEVVIPIQETKTVTPVKPLYITPFSPTPSFKPPIFPFAPLGFLGGMRKSIEYSQRAVLDYFNELRVAFGMLYKKKRKRRKRK